MSSHRLRTSVPLALLAAVVLAALLVAACSSPASEALGGSPEAPGDGSSAAASGSASGAPAEAAGTAGATGAKAATGDDWSRVLAVLAFMRAEPPAKPVVVLLGGSAARESTISDASWREQIVAGGGPETLAWNLGSRNRTMAQNVAIVRSLPEGVPAIVFIGINLGAFTSSQKSATITLPSPAPDAVSLQQPHQYTKSAILTKAKKKVLVRQWLAERYPVYKRNFATSAAVLEKLIRVCQARGYKPVLFELPRNTAVIGSSLAAPTKKYRQKCAALRTKYGVPWISLVSAARLPDSSFYDLWHLVEPGREVWQGLLSARTAALLERYGFDGGGS